MTVAPERDAAPHAPHRKDLRAASALVEPHRRLPALRFPHLPSERLRSSRTSLGTGFIGIAATLVAVLLLSFDLARFVGEWRDRTYSEPGLAALAWLLLAGLLVVLAVAARTAGDVLDSLVSLAIVGGLGVVVALDAAAVWANGDLGHDLTAAPAAGYVLLAMVGVRSSRSITAASGLLGAALIALLALNALDATVPPPASWTAPRWSPRPWRRRSSRRGSCTSSATSSRRSSSACSSRRPRARRASRSG
ncbi:hypothetical protein [Amnibacterium kyonggiense]